jgi:hypothetical protein
MFATHLTNKWRNRPMWTVSTGANAALEGTAHKPCTGRTARRSVARVRAFHGHFETHLTLAAADHESAAAWADAHGVKFARIVLDLGDTPDQPMLTVKGHGTLAGQRLAARVWCDRLRAAGFTVVRVKVEASPFNDDVPVTTPEAADLPTEYHFEHHVKLVLSGDRDVTRAREISERHGGHLSRNARRALENGRHERFVTQRCYGIGRTEARRRLDAMLADLTGAGFPPAEVEQEFVVMDDNPALDRGWIGGR